MRDMDSLLSSVRNPASRGQLREVVRAYQAGAFRAAIISTWVAVALDLVSKLREIADDGDAAAASEIAAMDAAIVNGDLSKLQKFENGLLDICRDKFELINGRDHLVLSRLVHDRNSCAHPAFVAPDDVFAPTAELARSHIVSAVDAVLQHPPTPGKRIVQRFITEIGSSAWPSDDDDLVSYLRERYFGQQRESAKRQLAGLILKCSLALPTDVPNRSRLMLRYPQCARALNEVAPALFEEVLTEIVRKKEETVGLSEDEIRFGIGALGDIAAFWEALPGGSGPRIVECIETSTGAQLVEAGALSVAPPDAGVGEEVNVLLGERLKDIEARLLVDALSLRSVPKLVDQAVARIENSGSWSTTNTLMPLMPALVPTMTVEHVKRLCIAATTNYEIYQANSADFEFTRLFELTNEWVDARNDWIELARFEHPYNNNVPAFPDARAAVIARWGAGVL